MRICDLCGESFNVARKGDTRKYCYVCSPSFHKNNPEEHKRRQVAFRQALKRYGINLLGGRCEICGYDKCVGALCFHHKDPGTKEYDFNTGDMCVEKYKKELLKCQLLCANCHAEKHNNIAEQPNW